MGLLRSNRVFARFWSAGLCFMLAWWALHAVMLIHVFQLTGSAFATGLIPVFSSIPGILLGPVAGVLVDRWNRQRVMAGSALALVALLLIAIPLAGSGVALLYAIIFTQSMVMTLFSPAENALLPSLVPDYDLRTANSLNALNDGLGRIVGPPIGTLLIVHQGLAVTFAACALIYLAGWGFLVGLHDDRPPVPAAESSGFPAAVQSVWAAFRDGLRVIGTLPLLGLAVTCWALALVADVPLSAVIPAFMQESVGVSAEFFGNTMSLRGVTGLLGGLLVVWLSRRVHETTLLAGGLLLQGLSYFAFGAGNNVFWSIAILFPVGPADVAIQTGLYTILQKASPDAMRGRIFATANTINGLVVLTVSIVAGSLGDAYGTRPIVIAAGCLHLLPLLVAILIMRRRNDAARAGQGTVRPAVSPRA